MQYMLELQEISVEICHKERGVYINPAGVTQTESRRKASWMDCSLIRSDKSYKWKIKAILIAKSDTPMATTGKKLRSTDHPHERWTFRN